jgi:hypothetical protein
MKQDFNSLLEPDRELSKDLFIINFLPYFCGEQVADKEVLRAWFNVASTPFHSVRIVENGQTVAIVPPIQDIEAFSPISGDKRRQNNTPSIIEQSELRAAINPIAGVSTAADGLTARFLTTEFQPSDKHRKAWEDMLAIFGKTLTPGQASASAPGASTSERSNEELEDYD